MVVIKSPKEIEKMRAANQVVAKVLTELRTEVRPGCTTRRMDALAEKIIRDAGATPAFKGYRGFPATLCTSINDVVVHGIPSDTMLEEGDIIGVDCGALLDGYYGDSACTYAVGKVSEEAKRLMKATEESLWRGIEAMEPGNRLFDISAAIQDHVESKGFSVVRDFVGHGIGRQLHEEPQVPNYGVAGRGVLLSVGMVLALEPMVNAGSYEVYIGEDGWTARTRDGRLSAHFEHTVAVTEDGPSVLSDRAGLAEVG